VNKEQILAGGSEENSVNPTGEEKREQRWKGGRVVSDQIRVSKIELKTRIGKNN